VKTSIDLAKDELIDQITDEFTGRVDITFDELKAAVINGFNKGVEATEAEGKFQIGQRVWFFSTISYLPGKPAAIPGTIIAYDKRVQRSADRRELYKRIKYTVLPDKSYMDTFISNGNASDIFPTQEEALASLALP
jgi:hypothetical protein